MWSECWRQFWIRGIQFGFVVGAIAAAGWGLSQQPKESGGNTIVTVVSEQCNALTETKDAREQAKLLYQVYASTLEVLHDHYFHANKAVLPARAMKDIFKDVDDNTRIQTRWIAVNTRPMSLDHEPKSDFEREAAKRIAAGEKGLEYQDGDTYRFAGSIPLAEGCIHCHVGSFAAPSPKRRFAGLIINIPLNPTSKAKVGSEHEK